MTDGYLEYGETYSSNRNTTPSRRDSEAQKKVVSEMKQSVVTKSSSGNIVYINKKSSYGQVRYVHKQDKKSV